MSYLEILYKRYPQIVRTCDDVAYDKDDNEVSYDKEAIIAEANQYQQEQDSVKTSALSKLSALGLTADEISAITGVK